MLHLHMLDGFTHHPREESPVTDAQVDSAILVAADGFAHRALGLEKAFPFLDEKATQTCKCCPCLIPLKEANVAQIVFEFGDCLG